jgi:hypothetical protein
MPVRVRSSVIKTMAKCILNQTYSESKKRTKGSRSMSAVSLRSGGAYKCERRRPQRSSSTSGWRRNIAGGPRSTSAVGLRSGSTSG